MKHLAITLFLVMLAAALWRPIEDYFQEQRIETQRREEVGRQIRELINKINSERDDAGAFKRYSNNGATGVNDPWGTEISSVPVRSGIMEVLEVRSAGKDKSFFTDDDIIAKSRSMNFKGLREGVIEDAQELAKEKAKGTVKGIAEGIRESFKK